MEKDIPAQRTVPDTIKYNSEHGKHERAWLLKEVYSTAPRLSTNVLIALTLVLTVNYSNNELLTNVYHQWCMLWSEIDCESRAFSRCVELNVLSNSPMMLHDS